MSTAPNDFMQIFAHAVNSVDWSIILCMAVMFLLVISDVFNEHVLTNFAEAFHEGEITAYGHMLQLGALVLGTLAGRAALAVL